MIFQADTLIIYFYLKYELDIKPYISSTLDIWDINKKDLTYIGYNIYIGYNRFGLIKNDRFYYIEYDNVEAVYTKIRDNPIFKEYNLELYHITDTGKCHILVHDKFDFITKGFEVTKE